MSGHIKRMLQGVLGLFLGLLFFGMIILFLESVLKGNPIHSFWVLALFFLSSGLTRAINSLSE